MSDIDIGEMTSRLGDERVDWYDNQIEITPALFRYMLFDILVWFTLPIFMVLFLLISPETIIAFEYWWVIYIIIIPESFVMFLVFSFYKNSFPNAVGISSHGVYFRIDTLLRKKKNHIVAKRIQGIERVQETAQGSIFGIRLRNGNLHNARFTRPVAEEIKPMLDKWKRYVGDGTE